MKNFPKIPTPKEDYVGVVVTTSNLRFWHPLFIYASGVMMLIESLKMKNHIVKVLTNFKRDFDKQEFKKMVDDPNCKELYILGHGLKHALKVAKDEYLFYCEFKEAPPKERVIQLHCNHMAGKSLAYYLNAKEDFETKGMRYLKENIRYCLNKLNES